MSDYNDIGDQGTFKQRYEALREVLHVAEFDLAKFMLDTLDRFVSLNPSRGEHRFQLFITKRLVIHGITAIKYVRMAREARRLIADYNNPGNAWNLLGGWKGITILVGVHHVSERDAIRDSILEHAIERDAPVSVGFVRKAVKNANVRMIAERNGGGRPNLEEFLTQVEEIRAEFISKLAQLQRAGRATRRSRSNAEQRLLERDADSIVADLFRRFPDLDAA